MQEVQGGDPPRHEGRGRRQEEGWGGGAGGGGRLPEPEEPNATPCSPVQSRQKEVRMGAGGRAIAGGGEQ